MHDIQTFGDYCSFEYKNYKKRKLQVRSQIVDFDVLMDFFSAAFFQTRMYACTTSPSPHDTWPLPNSVIIKKFVGTDPIIL